MPIYKCGETETIITFNTLHKRKVDVSLLYLACYDLSAWLLIIGGKGITREVVKLTYLEDVRHFKKMMKARARIMSTASTTLLGIDIFSTIAEIETRDRRSITGTLIQSIKCHIHSSYVFTVEPLKFT